MNIPVLAICFSDWDQGNISGTMILLIDPRQDITFDGDVTLMPNETIRNK